VAKAEAHQPLAAAAVAAAATMEEMIAAGGLPVGPRLPCRPLP
jgi:hypothetical protein